MSRWVGAAAPARRVLSGASYDRRYGAHAGSEAGVVGSSIWMTPGGVQDEIANINTDFVLFLNEFKEYVFAHGYPDHVEPAARAAVDLYVGVWIPLLQQWTAFYADHKGWTDNLWWNHAPTAEDFQARLIDVRQQAVKLGVVVRSPEPRRFAPSALLDPHHNIVDDAAEAARKAAADLMTILKFGLVAALGLTGVAAAVAISRGGRR